METTIAKVYRTTNYSRFRRLEGNREVLESRVNKIIKSIESVGYIMSPIICNEKNEIVDGQARKEAFERLGIPVDYITVNGIGINECIAMNINQSNWTMEDFIESYAEMGNPSYRYFAAIIKEFKPKHLPVGAMNYALTDRLAMDKDSIKEGKFKCTAKTYELARRKLSYAADFVPFFKEIKGRVEYYYHAICFLYSLPDVDPNRLYQKVRDYRVELYPIANTEQAVGVLEKIYNIRTRYKDKIYAVTEYQKFMDEHYMKKLECLRRGNEQQKSTKRREWRTRAVTDPA